MVFMLWIYTALLRDWGLCVPWFCVAAGSAFFPANFNGARMVARFMSQIVILVVVGSSPISHPTK
jgi:hypothetical protein